MGSIGECFDNSVIESFFGTLQRELQNGPHLQAREELAAAIFDWIETWCNPDTTALNLPGYCVGTGVPWV